MKTERNSAKNTRENLNYFSEKLTLELKSILESQFSVKPDGIELQEIGRHIAQFVLLKEVL